MTEQEMLARIKELEDENAALKRNFGKEKKLAWSKKMEEILPAYSADVGQLSIAIRKTCFRPVSMNRRICGRGQHGKNMETDCALRPSMMSDEEYIRYEEIMCEVLTVLRKYAVGLVDLSALVTKTNTL